MSLCVSTLTCFRVQLYCHRQRKKYSITSMCYILWWFRIYYRIWEYDTHTDEAWGRFNVILLQTINHKHIQWIRFCHNMEADSNKKKKHLWFNCLSFCVGFKVEKYIRSANIPAKAGSKFCVSNARTQRWYRSLGIMEDVWTSSLTEVHYYCRCNCKEKKKKH